MVVVVVVGCSCRSNRGARKGKGYEMMKDSFFRQLSSEEIESFRQWADENWKSGDPINPTWYPEVRGRIAEIEHEASK